MDQRVVQCHQVEVDLERVDLVRVDSEGVDLERLSQCSVNQIKLVMQCYFLVVC